MRHSSLTVRESERAGAGARVSESQKLLSLKLSPCYNVTKIADLLQMPCNAKKKQTPHQK